MFLRVHLCFNATFIWCCGRWLLEGVFEGASTTWSFVNCGALRSSLFSIFCRKGPPLLITLSALILGTIIILLQFLSRCMTWKRNNIDRGIQAVKGGIIQTACEINLDGLFGHRTLPGRAQMSRWFYRLTSFESRHLIIKRGGQIDGVWANISALLPEDELLLDHLGAIEVFVIRGFEHLLIDEPLQVLFGIKNLDTLELRSRKTFGGQARLPIWERVSWFSVLVECSFLGCCFRGLIGNVG